MSYSKIDPEFKAKWVAALRSGDYIQGRGTLCLVPRSIMDDMEAAGIPMGPSRADAQFCCLGVACDISGGDWEDTGHDIRITPAGDLQPGYPSDSREHRKEWGPTTEFARWDWTSTNAQFVPAGANDGFPFLPDSPLDGHKSAASMLVDFNDDSKNTFDEIADWIEENL